MVGQVQLEVQQSVARWVPSDLKGSKVIQADLDIQVIKDLLDLKATEEMMDLMGKRDVLAI